jgi:hypothetical protein
MAMYEGVFSQLKQECQQLTKPYRIILGSHLYLYIKRFDRNFLRNHKYALGAYFDNCVKYNDYEINLEENLKNEL